MVGTRIAKRSWGGLRDLFTSTAERWATLHANAASKVSVAFDRVGFDPDKFAVDEKPRASWWHWMAHQLLEQAWSRHTGD